MSEIVTVGLDLVKNVFQVHGADASGLGVQRKKLRRDQVLAFFSQQRPCLVAMEARGGPYFWDREIGKLSHEVRQTPLASVKPFVKCQKRQKMGWLPPSPDGIVTCQGRGVQPHEKRGRQMKDTMIGVDLAKSVFQFHGAGLAGQWKFRKKVTRVQFGHLMAKYEPAVLVMEASGSASYLAREMVKLGHEVRLIAPEYVRPFVKRQRTMLLTPRQSSSRHSAPRCVLSSRSRIFSKPARCFPRP